ncbi:MAG: glycosyltransferase family 2 protein [Candidatus Omnitrophica bacterium]|nr:glycosyltransferase family 2 protein [Candidatus Omnitrophota bacterium]
MKKISAVIACYRDEQAIPIMYQRLTAVFNKIGIAYEIVFVNDGSPDNSEQVLHALVQKDAHVVAVNHSRNFNSQMAFTSGMEIATGDAVVLLDGDLQDPPELIEKFYEQWQGGFDVVYGVRVKREAPLVMQVAYKLFYHVFHAVSYIKIPLHAGDFSLMDRKVVDVMKSFPERDRFLRGLRAWTGFKQTGISYVRPERMFGKTTNNFWKNFNWATKGVFSFSYVPLEIMTFSSLIIFFLALVGIGTQIVLRFTDPTAPRGYTTIVVVILFMGAVQLLSISMLGQYIGRIFEEVKQRPKYIVKSIFRRDSATVGHDSTHT